jgi:hypothetical protein
MPYWPSYADLTPAARRACLVRRRRRKSRLAATRLALSSRGRGCPAQAQRRSRREHGEGARRCRSLFAAIGEAAVCMTEARKTTEARELAVAARILQKSKPQPEQSAAFKSLRTNREPVECRELLMIDVRLALIDFTLQEPEFSGQIFLLNVYVP